MTEFCARDLEIWILFYLNVVYNNKIKCACVYWLLRVACAVQHMHVMNAERFDKPVLHIWYFTVVMWGDSIWTCCLLFSAFDASGN